MDNFIVSARKYRPITFASVVGQSHITSTLKNAISRGQLAHAYLFCGPRGVGKTTCARIFAKAINCTNPKDSEACGECESCRGFNEGRSFNIHELDAASNNSVDDIRTLTDQVRIPPQIGRYSVYIIDEVHMLSQAAFNAFLKTLEEPPAHAIFILATTEKHKIIPTILSRCQIYDFNRIRVEDSVVYLKHVATEEAVTVDDESLNLIAQKADGGMRDALSMFDKAVAFCGTTLNFREVARTLNVLDYDTYFTITKHIWEGDYKSSLMLFDEVLKTGFSGQTFIAGLSNHFRDLLMCKDADTIPLLEVTGSLLERYRKQSAEIDSGYLFNAIALLSEVDNSFRIATNQRLHVELGLMKLCGLAQKKNSLASEKATLPPLHKDNNQQTGQNDVGSIVNNAKTELSSPTAKGDIQPSSAKDDTQVNPPQTAIDKHKSTQVQGDVVGDNPQNKGSEISSSINHATENAANDVMQESSPTSHPSTKADNKSSAYDTGETNKTLSGISINNILKGSTTKNYNTEEVSVSKPEQESDPMAEQKILGAKEEFIETLGLKRPRIATAFETMIVSDNKISLTVVSEVLREDIYAHQKEILGLLARLAELECRIDLEIDLKEDPTAVRPIKPEDKLAHLRAKNPILDEFRRNLGLEME